MYAEGVKENLYEQVLEWMQKDIAVEFCLFFERIVS